MIIPSRWRTLPFAVAATFAIVGTLVALYYWHLDLTLAHYDSRGHLIVARRIIDNITPGWRQVGAVWLPLPHLLNFLPVQIDAFYRTGASAVAISVVAFAVATGTIAWIALHLTESRISTLAAAAVFGLNANVLYLQATPMTEPLFLALILAAVALLLARCRAGPFGPAGCSAGPFGPAGCRAGPFGPADRDRMIGPASATVGLMFALACLTRYEAWPVTVAALVAAVWVLYRDGAPVLAASRRVAGIAVYPAAAVAGFSAFSRIVIGEWLTTDGFFVPDNVALGKPVVALRQIVWGANELSGPLTLTAAALGLSALLLTSLRGRRRADSILVLSLLASAALPWVAFVQGHPFRIRYMVPLIAAEAIGVGVALGIGRAHYLPGLPASSIMKWATALLVVLALAFEVRPVDLSAPMVLEAQWDVANARGRRQVTACLQSKDDGETIMASMGSLGHYMQETARIGFDLRRFLHEGNTALWRAALETPRPYAGWVLVEEQAEGGDMLAELARENPAFLAGFERLCEGGGVALYRRTAPAAAGRP